jgi:hypothetical protein
MHGAGSDYAAPRRWLTPSNSKACRWRAVGVVTSRKPGSAGSAGAMVFRQMVPRSASRVAKLCTGWAAGVCFVAALARARGERAAGATGLGRAAWAAGLSSSVNSRAASRACMCQLM